MVSRNVFTSIVGINIQCNILSKICPSVSVGAVSTLHWLRIYFLNITDYLQSTKWFSSPVLD